MPILAHTPHATPKALTSDTNLHKRPTLHARRGDLLISYFEGVGALNVQIGCSVIGNLPPEQSELNGIQLRSIEMGLQND